MTDIYNILDIPSSGSVPCLVCDGVDGATLAESLVVVASGNVGIGQSSPANKLHLSESGATSLYMQFTNATSGHTSTDGYFTGMDSAGNAYSWLRESGILYFATNNVERMRIDSSGNVGIGVTPIYPFHVVYDNNNWLSYLTNSNATAPYGLDILFSGASPNNNTRIFYQAEDSTAIRYIVYSNGGIANYQANNVDLSDERLKMDIVDAPSYLDKICSIPVRLYRYKDQTHGDFNIGIVAQEVEAVAPEFVDQDAIGVTPKDGIPIKGIFSSDLTYAYLKAIQELKAKIDVLESRLAG